MAVATKTRPASFRDDIARTRLADAKAKLAAAQADAATAEEAHDAAQRALREQHWAVSEIQERLDRIAAEYKHTHSAGRGEIAARYEVAKLPLTDAQRPLAELAEAERIAETALHKARTAVEFYRSHVRQAAEETIRAEMSPAVDQMVAAVRDAFDVILQHGADLAYLIDAGMVSRDAIDALGEGPRRMLTPMQSWKAFEHRYGASPWRHACAALEQDTDAPLPSPVNG